MQETLYRRPLPNDSIAFSSNEGREVFAEALSAGGLAGYFRLAEQFHTQSDPAFCGLGSLVVALNALGIDPGRLWKGPWRWFSEELLDCCLPLPEVRRSGLTLSELGCVARCNGADVEIHYAEESDEASFRRAVADASRGASVLIAAYDRAALGQTGSGHFSPIGGYSASRDLVLVLDVARFKYPPHWLAADKLYRAMLPVDAATGRSRGWLALRAREHGIALGFSLVCDAAGYGALAELLQSVKRNVLQASKLRELAQAMLPLIAHVELREASAPAHREQIASARAALRKLPAFAEIEASVGSLAAEPTTLLLLAFGDQLPPATEAHRQLFPPSGDEHAAIANEVMNLRAQLAALWSQARNA
ncbi:MAG: phytochelatin synthase family protein [Myxococcota bacterium]